MFDFTQYLEEIDNLVSLGESLNQFGASKGGLYEVLLARIVNGTALSTAKNTQEYDLVIDDIPYSLKRYGYSTIAASTQITTNIAIRAFLEENVSTITYDPLIIAQVVGMMRVVPVLIFSIDLNKVEYYMSSFNYDVMLCKVKKIIYKQNRKHSNYMLLDSEDQTIARVLYGGQTSNAFQRGVWVNYKPDDLLFDSIAKGRKFRLFNAVETVYKTFIKN